MIFVKTQMEDHDDLKHLKNPAHRVYKLNLAYYFTIV